MMLKHTQKNCSMLYVSLPDFKNNGGVTQHLSWEKSEFEVSLVREIRPCFGLSILRTNNKWQTEKSVLFLPILF